MTITAPIGTAPTIDGAVGVLEWSDAAQFALPYAGHAGTLYVKHDATNLYLAAVIQDSPPGAPPCCSLALYFDNDHKAYAPADARRLLDRLYPRLDQAPVDAHL